MTFLLAAIYGLVLGISSSVSYINTTEVPGCGSYLGAYIEGLKDYKIVSAHQGDEMILVALSDGIELNEIAAARPEFAAHLRTAEGVVELGECKMDSHIDDVRIVLGKRTKLVPQDAGAKIEFNSFGSPQ